MRRWKTPDGRVLEELRKGDPAPAGYTLQDDKGRPVKGAVYQLLALDGHVERVYESSQGSVQEYLYWTGHVVEGSELRSWYNEDNCDSKAANITATMTVEISGLVELVNT
jgi:hypothetical protein